MLRLLDKTKIFAGVSTVGAGKGEEDLQLQYVPDARRV